MLEFNGPGVHVPLIEQVADALVNHLGCPTAAVAELTAALERVIANGTIAGADRCSVRFQTHDGTLDILLSSDDGLVWQTSCAIP